MRRERTWIAATIAVLVAAAVIGDAQQQQPVGDGQRGRGGRGGFVMGAALPPDGARPQLDKIKLPARFSIELFSDQVPGARSLALGSDGTVFVGTQRAGNVYAVVDRNKDHKADEVLTLASGLTQPNGVAFRDGALYVAEISKITRYDGVLDFAKAPRGGPAPRATVVTDKLPTDPQHGWKYIAFGPDGLLYVPIGAPGNIVDRGDPYAAIHRMKPDGGGMEVFARGVRNTVGFTWHPDTREMWFTDNGRDTLGDETPNDELNVAPKPGLHFGYPYCHEGELLDPQFGKGKNCADYVAPVAKLGPHVAALGLKFYQGKMFPAEYQKALFIVNHGSWNRTQNVSHTGYRIMLAKVQNNKVTSYEPFAEGWLQAAAGSELKREAWGQPVDLLEMPDGSLLVSDDRAGAIYRIAYK